MEGAQGVLGRSAGLPVEVLSGIIAAATFAGLGLAYRRARRCRRERLEDCVRDLLAGGEEKRPRARRNLVACGAKAADVLLERLVKDPEGNGEVTEVLLQIGAPAMEGLLATRRVDEARRLVDKALGEHLPAILSSLPWKGAVTRLWPFRRHPQRYGLVMEEKLLTLLQDARPFVQEGAAIALAQWSEAEVIGRLGQKLCEPNAPSAVKVACAESLGKIRGPEAIPYLRVGLQDRSHEVCIACCEALAKIRQPEGVVGLWEAFLADETPTEVKREAARAVAEIDGRAGREILRVCVEGLPSESELRKFCSQELARLQSQRGAP